MKELLSNKYLKFAIVSIIYILWVIWLNNYWFLLGLAIIFDIYVSKKVNWSFWKKRNGKRNSKLVEWIDALIFAVVAVTIINIFLFQNFNIPTPSMEKSLLVGDYLFVSKVNYGPRIPNTPLSFPLVQHTLPLSKSTNSFLTWLKRPYKRLGGLSRIKNNNVVVFNFPVGDTVSTNFQSEISYYTLIKENGRERVNTDKRTFGKIVVRPVDKRENFIKRCVGIPGDVLEVIDNQLFINYKPADNPDKLQYSYYVNTNGSRINKRVFERLGISNDDVRATWNSGYLLPLTLKNVEELKKLPNVVSVERDKKPKDEYDDSTFPHHNNFQWNRDHYGPLRIPAKGQTIKLYLDSLAIYNRIIDVYENNDLEVRGEEIYINGEKTDEYTFKMDYYFMMGDNRHNSADSRFWGFVPEDHIVGKPLFVYFSLDKDKKFLSKIRWKRMFKAIK